MTTGVESDPTAFHLGGILSCPLLESHQAFFRSYTYAADLTASRRFAFSHGGDSQSPRNFLLAPGWRIGCILGEENIHMDT